MVAVVCAMGAGVRRCLMQAYNDLIRLCDAAGTRENVFEVIDAMEANKIQLDMDTMQVSKDVEMFCSAVGESLPSFVTCSLSGIRLCCGSASPCPVAHGPIRRRGPTGNARSDPGAPSPVRTGDAHAFGPPPQPPRHARGSLAVQALEEIFTLGTKRPLSPKEMEGGNKPKNAESRAT